MQERNKEDMTISNVYLPSDALSETGQVYKLQYLCRIIEQGKCGMGQSEEFPHNHERTSAKLKYGRMHRQRIVFSSVRSVEVREVRSYDKRFTRKCHCLPDLANLSIINCAGADGEVDGELGESSKGGNRANSLNLKNGNDLSKSKKTYSNEASQK